MIQRVLIAAAMMIATPGFLFSQDFFLSFDNDVLTTTLHNYGAAVTSGTVYLFAAEASDFDVADINLTSSQPNVVRLTGGVAIDDAFNTVGGTKFDSSEVTVDVATGVVRWFAINISQYGVRPGLSEFDPNFVPGVGTLLAAVDYEIVDIGGATLEISLGTQGVWSLIDGDLAPTFGSATLLIPLSPLWGDCNQDGFVNLSDISPFISILSGSDYLVEADINQDGIVDFSDIGLFIAVLSSQG